MLDKTALMEMMRRMLRIRHFEEAVISLVERGEIVGAAHSYIGEEAVAVGACMALRDDDWMTGNHRSHGHPIAKAATSRRPWPNCWARRPASARARAARCTWPTSASASWASRAFSAPPSRWQWARRWAAGAEQRPGGRLLLRRRRQQRGRLPRVHQPSRHLEAAGNLPLREQPVRRYQQLQGNGGG